MVTPNQVLPLKQEEQKLKIIAEEAIDEWIKGNVLTDNGEYIVNLGIQSSKQLQSVAKLPKRITEKLFAEYWDNGWDIRLDVDYDSTDGYPATVLKVKVNSVTVR